MFTHVRKSESGAGSFASLLQQHYQWRMFRAARTNGSCGGGRLFADARMQRTIPFLPSIPWSPGRSAGPPARRQKKVLLLGDWEAAVVAAPKK